MKKKWLVVMLALSCIITCGCSKQEQTISEAETEAIIPTEPETEPETDPPTEVTDISTEPESTTQTATEAPRQIWLEQLEENLVNYGSSSYQYAILYIDNDDSPEILTEYEIEPYLDANDLYTFGTGYAYASMQFETGPGIRFGGYKAKENLFWTDEGSGDGWVATFYCLEDGFPVELEHFLAMCDGYQLRFYINDAEVSETEFYNRYDAYPHDSSSDYTMLSYSEFKKWVEELSALQNEAPAGFDLAPSGMQAEITPTFSPVRAESSSQLADLKTNAGYYTYGGSNVLDGDSSTCWCERSSDSGIGESITLYASEPSVVSAITIENSLCGGSEIFYKNCRVKECEIRFSDGTVLNETLSGDYNAQPCTIKLPEQVVTDSITITIKSVYDGSKYTDTCISEIRVK